MPDSAGLETGIPLREAEPLLLASIFFTLFAAINEVRRDAACLTVERHPVTVMHPKMNSFKTPYYFKFRSFPSFCWLHRRANLESTGRFCARVRP